MCFSPVIDQRQHILGVPLSRTLAGLCHIPTWKSGSYGSNGRADGTIFEAPLVPLMMQTAHHTHHVPFLSPQDISSEVQFSSICAVPTCWDPHRSSPEHDGARQSCNSRTKYRGTASFFRLERCCVDASPREAAGSALNRRYYNGCSGNSCLTISKRLSEAVAERFFCRANTTSNIYIYLFTG